MIEVINHLNAEGFPIKEFIPDGKPRRFPLSSDDRKNSGFYIGYQNFATSTGESFYVVVFGSWREGTTKTFCTFNGKMNAADKKNMNEQMEKAKAKAEAVREQGFEIVSEEVTAIWESLSSEGTSEYLNKKQIASVTGLGIKFDDRGNLFIPMRDASGKLWSLQKIQWDGGKFFHPGGRVKTTFHTLGQIGSGIIRIAEGFATAASIRLATGEAVVCCFNAGNILAVAQEIKKKYPNNLITICGDDDQWTTRKVNGEDEPYNAGRIKAEEAAKAILGTAVFPVFKSPEKGMTDFNDLHCREGIEAVAEQLKSAEPPKKQAVYALGFNEDEYFFTSTSNRQIVSMKSLTEETLTNLMPIEYWEAVYPGTGAARVSWTDVRSDLKKQCRSRPLFTGFNVRGAGVWTDQGRVVVNMGDYLLVDGVYTNLGEIKSRYFYTLSTSLDELHPEPLTVEECQPLVDSCLGFKWTKKESAFLMGGILVLARVCGAIPVRPHAWITGGAETGKTTLLEKLVSKILGSSAVYVQGGSTEAGIRQTLKNNALPVMFDEFETNGNKRDESIQSIIELCRAAWSDSHANIVKGGATGNATHYKVRFSAIVSSIRTKLDNDADKGRFAILELAPHGGDQEHWNLLKGNLGKINGEFAERLFARTVKMLPIILENYKVFQAVLARKSGSRFGDQYGIIFAAWLSLMYDAAITEKNAEDFLDAADFTEDERAVKTKDHEDALQALLTTAISFDSILGRQERTLGAIIESIAKTGQIPDPAEVRALLNLGIKVESEYVAIRASGHAQMKQKIWRGTKWESCWGVTLARIDGAQKGNLRFDGSQAKCVKIPLSVIFS